MSRYIPLFDYFVFNGKSSLDFRCKMASGNETFISAQRDIESVEVPGRSGNLTIDNKRFRNVTIPYECFIVENFNENLRSLVEWLMQSPGYLRLEDTYHPNEFRMARYVGPLDPKVTFAEEGSFTLDFDCQPQRWLTIGEKPVAVSAGSSVKLKNPTRQKALPKILVAGTGTFSVGSNTATLSANNGSTVVDSEIMDTYEGATNRNGNISFSAGKYPELPAGDTTIAAGSGVSLIVFPRWWTL